MRTKMTVEEKKQRQKENAEKRAEDRKRYPGFSIVEKHGAGYIGLRVESGHPSRWLNVRVNGNIEKLFGDKDECSYAYTSIYLNPEDMLKMIVTLTATYNDYVDDVNSRSSIAVKRLSRVGEALQPDQISHTGEKK